MKTTAAITGNSVRSNVSALSGRVLVVEDNPLVRAGFNRVLGLEREVQAVESGSAAKVLLSIGVVFDVILCELMMPIVSGVDLYEWLDEKNPDLARNIIFVTGGNPTPQAIAFLKKNMNPRFEKPFKWRALQKLVSTMINKGASVR